MKRQRAALGMAVMMAVSSLSGSYVSASAMETWQADAEVIPEEELNPEYVIPSSFDKRVALAVANAVAKAAVEEGINRVPYTEIK